MGLEVAAQDLAEAWAADLVAVEDSLAYQQNGRLRAR